MPPRPRAGKPTLRAYCMTALRALTPVSSSARSDVPITVIESPSPTGLRFSSIKKGMLCSSGRRGSLYSERDGPGHPVRTGRRVDDHGVGPDQLFQPHLRVRREADDGPLDVGVVDVVAAAVAAGAAAAPGGHTLGEEGEGLRHLRPQGQP